MKLSNADESIKEAVISEVEQKEERKSVLRISSEYITNDRVWVRPLKKCGKIIQLPTYNSLDYSVKLDDQEEPIKVNWYNLFFEEEKDKYNFQAPVEQKKEEENVEEILLDLSAL